MKVIERKWGRDERNDRNDKNDRTKKEIPPYYGSRWSKQPLVEKFHEIPKEKKR